MLGDALLARRPLSISQAGIQIGVDREVRALLCLLALFSLLALALVTAAAAVGPCYWQGRSSLDGSELLQSYRDSVQELASTFSANLHGSLRDDVGAPREAMLKPGSICPSH